MDLKRWLDGAATAIADWQTGFAPFTTHPSLQVSDEQLAGVFAEFTDRLGTGNYPYFHPDYAGQMLKPPHPVAVAGYLAAMLINPNNHALDGGRATSEMEKEAVAQLAAMFGLPAHLGHLTSSGTIANLEALYVARELSPGLAIACSEEAHYTHARMAGLLGIPAVKVAVDERGRIDPAALDEVLARGEVGTVVATAGTTGLGAIDPVHEILAVARRHGVRVHVDAAYGGFFTLLAGRADRSGLEPEPWRAISACDSVVGDPHKHGLQPYGCGAVLFADPSVPGSTGTTRRIPTSLPTSCIWARSAWNARGPGQRRPRCGSPSGCCRRGRVSPAAWARCSRPGAGRRWTGRRGWPARTGSTCTSRPSWTSCATSR